MPGSNFMEGGVEKTPQCYKEIKSPVLIGLRGWQSKFSSETFKESFEKNKIMERLVVAGNSWQHFGGKR